MPYETDARTTAPNTSTDNTFHNTQTSYELRRVHSDTTELN